MAPSTNPLKSQNEQVFLLTVKDVRTINGSERDQVKSRLAKQCESSCDCRDKYVEEMTIDSLMEPSARERGGRERKREREKEREKEKEKEKKKKKDEEEEEEEEKEKEQAKEKEKEKKRKRKRKRSHLYPSRVIQLRGSRPQGQLVLTDG